MPGGNENEMSAQRHGENGAVAVIVAIVLMVLLGVSAIVIDLGALRADRAAGKAVGDMAAAAGAVGYEAGVEGAALEACKAALTYAVKNLDLSNPPTATEVEDLCSTKFPASYVCSPTDDPPPPEQTVTYAHEPYAIEVTLPVHDGNEHMSGQDTAVEDGVPCERVAVRVTRDRNFALAPAIGYGDEGATRPGSVARASRGTLFDEFPSLVVLRREGCNTLRKGGGGEGIEVLPFTDPATGKTYTGIISVDTLRESCHLIRVDGGGAIRAPDGSIFSYAMQAQGATRDEVVWDQGENAEVSPDPEAGPLITRKYIDHRYNCQSTYSARPANNHYDPIAAQIPIDPCDGPDAPSSSYIGAWHQTVLTTAATVDGGSTPTGWRVIGTGGNCPTTNYTAGGSNSPRVFLNCRVRNNNVTLEGVEHVIVNQVDLNGAIFRVNVPPSAQPGGGAILAIRDHDIKFTGGGTGMQLHGVFTYHMQGGWDLAGNPDRLMMMAPLDPSNQYGDAQCHGEALPAAKCFAPLAYWTNDTGAVEIRGGGSGGIIGTIFAPNATVDANPAVETPGPCNTVPTWTTLENETGGSFNLRGAQIFASAYDMGGGATLHMCPSPTTTVGIPMTTVGLIR
jgi:hypothetical protein